MIVKERHHFACSISSFQKQIKENACVCVTGSLCYVCFGVYKNCLQKLPFFLQSFLLCLSYLLDLFGYMKSMITGYPKNPVSVTKKDTIDQIYQSIYNSPGFYGSLVGFGCNNSFKMASFRPKRRRVLQRPFSPCYDTTLYCRNY